MTATQHTSTAPRDVDIDELPALFDGVIKLARARRSGSAASAFR